MGVPNGLRAVDFPGWLTAFLPALQRLDSVVDYSRFDNDNDGSVDEASFVHDRSLGELTGAETDTVWSHTFTLSALLQEPYRSADERDGRRVVVDRYAVVGGRRAPSFRSDNSCIVSVTYLVCPIATPTVGPTVKPAIGQRWLAGYSSTMGSGHLLFPAPSACN